MSAFQARKLESHLAACAACRQELSSLQSTVGLLRRMPTTPPPRSFVFASVPVVARPQWAPRVPSWAYGAVAASLVLLLAGLVSADLAGTLERDSERLVEPVATAVPGATAQALDQAASRAPEGPASTETASMASPEPQPAPAPEEAVARLAEVEDQATPTPDATPAPEAADQESEATMEMAAQAVAPPPGTPSPTDIPPPATTTTPEPAATATPTPTPAPVAEMQAPALQAEKATEQPLSTPQPGPQPSAQLQEPGTSILWRVLEGLLAFLVVVALGGTIWRIRRVRRLKF